MSLMNRFPTETTKIANPTQINNSKETFVCVDPRRIRTHSNQFLVVMDPARINNSKGIKATMIWGLIGMRSITNCLLYSFCSDGARRMTLMKRFTTETAKIANPARINNLSKIIFVLWIQKESAPTAMCRLGKKRSKVEHVAKVNCSIPQSNLPIDYV